jgi:hypothetical protein
MLNFNNMTTYTLHRGSTGSRTLTALRAGWCGDFTRPSFCPNYSMRLTMCHKLKSALQTRQDTGNAEKFGRVLDVVSPPKFWLTSNEEYF